MLDDIIPWLMIVGVYAIGGFVLYAKGRKQGRKEGYQQGYLDRHDNTSYPFPLTEPVTKKDRP